MNKVKDFMAESGYTNFTCDLGVRRDYKNSENWTFDKPEEMLKKFYKFLRDNE